MGLLLGCFALCYGVKVVVRWSFAVLLICSAIETSTEKWQYLCTMNNKTKQVHVSLLNLFFNELRKIGLNSTINGYFSVHKVGIFVLKWQLIMFTKTPLAIPVEGTRDLCYFWTLFAQTKSLPQLPSSMGRDA